MRDDLVPRGRIIQRHGGDDHAALPCPPVDYETGRTLRHGEATGQGCRGDIRADDVLGIGPRTSFSSQVPGGVSEKSALTASGTIARFISLFSTA